MRHGGRQVVIRLVWLRVIYVNVGFIQSVLLLSASGHEAEAVEEHHYHPDW